MKNRYKIIIFALAAVALLWCGLFAADYHAVMNLQDPLIAQHTGAEGGTYRGIGWTVELEKIHRTENGEDLGYVPVSAEIYLFGILVGAAIT